jgi:hypothetical protein
MLLELGDQGGGRGRLRVAPVAGEHPDRAFRPDADGDVAFLAGPGDPVPVVDHDHVEAGCRLAHRAGAHLQAPAGLPGRDQPPAAGAGHPIPAGAGRPAREDYENQRRGGVQPVPGLRAAGWLALGDGQRPAHPDRRGALRSRSWSRSTTPTPSGSCWSRTTPSTHTPASLDKGFGPAEPGGWPIGWSGTTPPGMAAGPAWPGSSWPCWLDRRLADQATLEGGSRRGRRRATGPVVGSTGGSPPKMLAASSSASAPTTQS